MNGRLDSGYYFLLIHLKRGRTIRVGRRDDEFFPGGYYIYTGSAKRGLRSRVERHKRDDKRLHWHVDYLLAEAEFAGAYEINVENGVLESRHI